MAQLYPFELGKTQGKPGTAGMIGTITETAGYPEAYNIETGPKEQVNQILLNAGLVAPCLQVANGYLETLKRHPNLRHPVFARERNQHAPSESSFKRMMAVA